MEKSMMSAKAMLDLYVSYGLSAETWEMLYEMVCHGLITSEAWAVFYDECADYVWADDEALFINGQNVIINGEGKVIYYYDADGFMKKAA